MRVAKSLLGFVLLVPVVLVQMALWVVRRRVDTRFVDRVMSRLHV